MPADKLAGLIAHELGHVWAYGNPESESSKMTGRVGIEELNAIKEREADELASKWGHDMKTLRAWANDQATKAQLLKLGCSFPEGAKY